VNIKVSNDGKVLSMDSTSNELNTTLSTLIPGILLAILAAGLVYYLISKSKKGQIKTAVQHLNS
jgi:hypothetical protein